MGFDQSQNKRVYKFDFKGVDRSTTRFVISVDMVLFLRHHVGVQEGPVLCARKLTADFEAARCQGDHELTNDDLLEYVAGRAAAEARRAEARRPGPTRRKPEPGQVDTPWRKGYV